MYKCGFSPFLTCREWAAFIFFVGLSNILYSKGRKLITRRSPSERSHRAGVAATLVGSELPTKVGERVEAVVGVEAFLVFTVTAFDLAVMTGCIGPNKLVENANLGGCMLE